MTDLRAAAEDYVEPWIKEIMRQERRTVDDSDALAKGKP